MTSAVLYGPGLAGKATLMVEFARFFSTKLRPFHVPVEGYPGSDDVGIELVGRWADRDFRIRTFSGSVFGDGAWPNAIGDCTSMAVIVPPDGVRADASREALTRLEGWSKPSRICVARRNVEIGANGTACTRVALFGREVPYFELHNDQSRQHLLNWLLGAP